MTNQASDPAPKLGCGYAFCTAVVLAGAGILAAAVWSDGWTSPGVRTAAFIAGVAIALAGMGFIVPMRRAMRAHNESLARQAAHPGEPWLWRPEWRGPIQPEQGRAASFFWGFAIVWNAVAWVGPVVTWRDLRGGDWSALLVWIFPAAGIGLLVLAVRHTIRARKFGKVVFLPSNRSGSIGGYLGGVITVPRRFRPEKDVLLTLVCIRTERRGSGDDSRVVETPVWKAEQRVARERCVGMNGACQIPVLFYVPPGRSPSDPGRGHPRIFWRLAAECPVDGLDFGSSFEVPVFVTGETAPAPDAQTPLLDAYRGRRSLSEEMERAGTTFRPNGTHGMPEFDFAAPRIPGTWVLFALVVGMAGLAGFLILEGTWVGVAFAGFFLCIFGLLAWASLGHRTSVRIGPDELVVTRRRLIGSRSDRVPLAAVGSVVAEKTFSSDLDEYFQLVALGSTGADPHRAAPDEPFRLRKARFRLRRAMRELGITDPAMGGERTRLLLEQIRSEPSFRLPLANRIPGKETAERLAGFVEEKLAGTPGP